MDDIAEMKELIENMRSRLHNAKKGKCLADPELLKLSQELNEVLNRYDRLLTKNCLKE